MSCPNRRKRGAVAVAFAISLVVIIGFAAMAVDLGRLMMIKGEVQDFCDAAALAAAQALDGVSFAAADAAAMTEWKSWDMQNESFISNATIVVQYSASANGPWLTSAQGPTASDHIYVRVQATVQPAVYLLPVISGSTTSTVVAAAVAGQVELKKMSVGLFPFAVIPVDLTYGDRDNYGFQQGMTYAFRWSSQARQDLDKYIEDPKPANLRKLEEEFCDGDLYYADGTLRSPAELQQRLSVVNPDSGSSIRGFFVDEYFSNAKDYRLLVLNGTPGGTSLEIGGSLLGAGVDLTPKAVNSIYKAILERIGYDTYKTAWRYNSSGPPQPIDSRVTPPNYYKRVNDPVHGNPGNFIRIVIVPIVDPSGGIKAFRAFLLGPAAFYEEDKRGNAKWCAEYVGNWAFGGNKPTTQPGIYIIRLVR